MNPVEILDELEKLSLSSNGVSWSIAMPMN